MLLKEISNMLNEEELVLVESGELFGELKELIKKSIQFSLERVAKSLHDFASQQIHKFGKESKEYKTLDKIISNPKVVANQLMSIALSKSAPETVPENPGRKNYPILDLEV